MTVSVWFFLFHQRGSEMIHKNEFDVMGVKRWLVAALIVSVVLMGVAVTFLLQMYQARNEVIFHELIEDNLQVSHQGQVQEIKGSIQEMRRILEAMAAVYQTSQGSPEDEWGQAYLRAIREMNELYDVTYFSTQTMQGLLESDYPGPDREIVAHLLAGETEISDIFKSSRLGDLCVFSVAVPVTQNGEVIGAYRSLLRAELLIGVGQKREDHYGDNYLLLRNGDIVLDGQDYVNGQANLLADLQAMGADAQAIAQVEEALASAEEQLIYIQGKKQEALFLVLSPLGYNDWMLLSVAHPYDVKDYAASIMHNTLVLVGALLVFLALLLGSVGYLFVQQREKMMHDQARYDLLAKFSDTILFEYDCKLKRLIFTPNIEARFRLQKGAIRPLDESYHFEMIHPDDQAALKAFLGRVEQMREDVPESIMLRFLDRLGQYRWMECQGQLIREKNGRPLVLIGKIADVHEQKEQEAWLREKASLEGMTGALNRETAEREITRELALTEAGFLFMIDVDNFKQVNDTLGHAKGDELLIQMVEDIKGAFRQEDLVGRTGGDEFVVFMSHTHDQAAACLKAERLLESLSERREGRLSVSIGIAAYPEAGRSFSELFEAADKAMYEAKRQGKRGYQLTAKPPEAQ